MNIMSKKTKKTNKMERISIIWEKSKKMIMIEMVAIVLAVEKIILKKIKSDIIEIQVHLINHPKLIKIACAQIIHQNKVIIYQTETTITIKGKDIILKEAIKT